MVRSQARSRKLRSSGSGSGLIPSCSRTRGNLTSASPTQAASSGSQQRGTFLTRNSHISQTIRPRTSSDLVALAGGLSVFGCPANSRLRSIPSMTSIGVTSKLRISPLPGFSSNSVGGAAQAGYADARRRSSTSVHAPGAVRRGHARRRIGARIRVARSTLSKSIFKAGWKLDLRKVLGRTNTRSLEHLPDGHRQNPASSDKLQLSTYHASSSSRSSKRRAWRPFTAAHPVIPGRMSWRRRSRGV